MKPLTLLSGLILASVSMLAQVPIVKTVGDTLGPWTTIQFEEPSPYIQNSPSLQNSWQIGTPQKTLFNQAFSPPNAIVTELMSYYMVNNHSWFDLLIGDFNTQGMFMYDLFIDFRHKIDSDTMHDGGYITVSWDHGQTWMNILDDSLSQQYYFISPARNFGSWGNTNLYTSSDTLFNGEKGFSGTSGGWVQSCMAWYNLPVKTPGVNPPDTMILRFNFISDNLNHNKEGWMIDDIRIYSIDLGSGIRENKNNPLQCIATPNPMLDHTRVYLNKTYSKVEYQLIDPSGRIILLGKPGNCNDFILQRAGLSTGIYLLKVTDGGYLNSVCRIVVF